MKKTLLAMGVLGAFSSLAFAASNVTLYGLIEEGVVVSKAKHKDTIVDLKAGFDSGNRWGIKGVEELGNGYSVGFILEQGFNADDGSEGVAGKAFNRESILYVNGGFGSVAFGRTGGLAFSQSRAILSGWVFGTGYGSGAWNAIDFVAKRMNNVVSYSSPSFGGVTIHAMYSNSGSNELAVDDKNKWSKNGHYYGIGAKYANGPILSSLIFEATQNKNSLEVDGKEQITNHNPKYGINYGLSWDFGAVTPMFAYQYVWQDQGNKDHQFGLSAKINAGGGAIKVGARYTFGKNDGAAAGTEDKHNAWLVGAAYEYPLSKRTMIKSYAGYADGGKAWKDTTDTKYNGYQVYLGLCHKF